MKDIRWEQRFENFERALEKLKIAVALSNERELSELEKQGLIQGFKYTHELAWKVLKDFISDRGNTTIYGSKDATREAFRLGLIEQGDVWMDMIKSRNKTSHTYNETTAEEIVQAILGSYYSEFVVMNKKMSELKTIGNE